MCKCVVLISISVVIASLILLVDSFNVDTINYVQHERKNDSMFGFSVATHKGHGKNWVLVGAPTAQGQTQSGIKRGGVVFKCSTTRDNGCEEINFHQETSERGRQLDDKNNQWFGATVSSAGPGGPVVACAPRYVWFTTSREERRDPVGTCYIAKDDFRQFSEYSPCRTSLFGYHRQGSCQAGFSAGISNDGTRLFVGAPGSWYWQGQMYSIDPKIKFPFTPGIFGEAFGFGTKGQVIQQSLDARPAVMSTPEGPAINDDTYMGYSMVVGDFNSEGVQGIAVGMPKGGDCMHGKVLLYTWNLTNYLNVTGNQTGEYYGYAVGTSDIDGDGKTDLIVGAPLHTEKNTEMKYDVGRIYVSYQKDGYSRQVHLDGFDSKSRFGHAIGSLGDLNRDGYGDFAVGAPYGGKNGRGAVYIFQGSNDGVVEKYSQVIYAEDLDSNLIIPLSTFGFSIGGGLDLDDNDYPDMAIGAYLSNAVYFFRARPVVKVKAEIKFDDPKVIRLDENNCPKPSDPRVMVTCREVRVCMSYTGVGTPPRVDLMLNYHLDAQKAKYSRMYMRGAPSMKQVNRTVTLFMDAPPTCDIRETVYLEEEIIDKLTDLEIIITYTLDESRYIQQGGQRDPVSRLLPIIDSSKVIKVNDSLSIYKNCGTDNQCVPDLHLSVEAVAQYLYEVGKSLELNVTVTNSEDDSYNTKFHIQLPAGFTFKVGTLLDQTQSKLLCSQTFNHSIYVCDIGNPLPKNSLVKFKIEVEPRSNQKFINPTYYFHLNVSSANDEDTWNLFDNTKTVAVDIMVDAILEIEGESFPANLYYNMSSYDFVTHPIWDSEVGPSVIHKYTITNKGPSDVDEVEIFILWPVSTLSGEDLLYILDQPHTLEGVTCDQVDANYKQYTLALQRNVWDATGINKGENQTEKFHIETNPPTIGETGNKITKTINQLTFYDQNENFLHSWEYIGEPGSEEYWNNVTEIASKYPQSLIVHTNMSSLIIEFYNGIEIDKKIVYNEPGSVEQTYLAYLINSNVSTVVSYLASGNLLYEEEIIEKPGSAAYNSRIESTKKRLAQPLDIRTSTTRHVECKGFDGKVLYHRIFNQAGTQSTSDSRTSTIITTTIVTFYDIDGKVLYEDKIEGKPGGKEYWEQVNKMTSTFNIPVTVHLNTTETTIYYVNGRESGMEQIPISPAAFTAPLKIQIDTSTLIQIFDLNHKLLHEEFIFAERGSPEYLNQYNPLVNRFREKESIMVITKTVKNIIYRTTSGETVYSGTITDISKETTYPLEPKTTRTETITVVTFYDLRGDTISQIEIMDEPESSTYWEKINAAINSFNTAVNIRTNTTKTIIYYINGQESNKESFSVPSGPTSFTTDIKTSTTIQITNMNGQLLYEGIVPGERNTTLYNINYNELVNRYGHEPIIIKTTTIRTIRYQSPDGRTAYTGTATETHTDIRLSSKSETSRTQTVTTVTFYDPYGSALKETQITDEPESATYWQKINEILAGFNTPINIRTNTTKTIIYYVDGKETHRQPSTTPVTPPVITTQVETSSTIRITRSTGEVLYEGVVPGEKGSSSYINHYNDIVGRFREPIVIVTQTTKTITYSNSFGQTIHRGTTTETHTETRNVNQNETSRIQTVTTVIFYDVRGIEVHRMNITDIPESREYWEKINAYIKENQQQITMEVRTTRIKIYYANGQPIRTENAGGTSGTHYQGQIRVERTIKSEIKISNRDGTVLHQGTIGEPKGTSVYNDYINSIVSRFREPVTVFTKTNYAVVYRSSSGEVLNNASSFTEDTQNFNNNNQRETKVERTFTTITFYGPNGNLLHRETIQGEPGSTRYWEQIKNAIASFTYPINIHTNTSQIVTYYINGAEVRDQRIRGNAGVYESPFTSKVEITNVIAYYDGNRNVLYQENVNGELTQEERSRRMAAFTKRFSGSFTMETTTTKTITYRTTDGRVLFSDEFLSKPSTVPQALTKTTTQTTFTVYGPDRRQILHQETIEGEPGSTSYNAAVANIISRFSGSITIYTNSTKTITFYNAEGRPLNHQFQAEPRSTVERERSASSSGVTTRITFYDSKGQPIHHGTIEGTGSAGIRSELDRIAKDFGGIVKSYGGEVHPDGSIGGAVTYVDTPYPGNRPSSTNGHHIDSEFRSGETRWASNRSGYGGEGSRDGDHHGSGIINLDDINLERDLGSFATRGKGLRVGGIDLDETARSNFDALTESYDGSHNFLPSQTHYRESGTSGRLQESSGYHGRSKRQDLTEIGIETLRNCATSKCITIRCVTEPMHNAKEVHIALRARVNVQTLKTISTTQQVNIQSMLLARISHFQTITGAPAVRTLYRKEAVTSVIPPQLDIKPDIVPLWVVILSAVAGTLILLLLIFLLHKCGFFKRNRPSDAPERQPLNRNGHFQHGDEAL